MTGDGRQTRPAGAEGPGCLFSLGLREARKRSIANNNNNNNNSRPSEADLSQKKSSWLVQAEKKRRRTHDNQTLSRRMMQMWQRGLKQGQLEGWDDEQRLICRLSRVYCALLSCTARIEGFRRGLRFHGAWCMCDRRSFSCKSAHG